MVWVSQKDDPRNAATGGAALTLLLLAAWALRQPFLQTAAAAATPAKVLNFD